MAFTRGEKSKASCFLERFVARSKGDASGHQQGLVGQIGTSLEAAAGLIHGMAQGLKQLLIKAWDAHYLVALKLHGASRYM